LNKPLFSDPVSLGNQLAVNFLQLHYRSKAIETPVEGERFVSERTNGSRARSLEKRHSDRTERYVTKTQRLRLIANNKN